MTTRLAKRCFTGVSPFVTGPFPTSAQEHHPPVRGLVGWVARQEHTPLERALPKLHDVRFGTWLRHYVPKRHRLARGRALANAHEVGWGRVRQSSGRCSIGEELTIIIAGVFSVLVVVATVAIIGRVLPGHWRARRWSLVVIDVMLIIGSLLIASRPVIGAVRLVI